jgi:hypothetical protein
VQIAVARVEHVAHDEVVTRGDLVDLAQHPGSFERGTTASCTRMSGAMRPMAPNAFFRAYQSRCRSRPHRWRAAPRAHRPAVQISTPRSASVWTAAELPSNSMTSAPAMSVGRPAAYALASTAGWPRGPPSRGRRAAARPDEGAHGAAGIVHVVEEREQRFHGLGHGQQPHVDLRRDAERALTADEHTHQVQPGSAAGPSHHAAVAIAQP